MNRRKKAALAAAIGGTPLLLIPMANAHGTMQNPVSRVYACYLEGPENPQSAACKAAVAAGGTQPLYDWNEINLANANGQSKSIIPDGKLCSAGRDKYKGFDLPRTDWPATNVSAGSRTFTFRATAPHRGSFELYLTKQGYNPANPLKWSDLDAGPFVRVTDPALSNGAYVFTGTIPSGRTGRHLIYVIWQRSDSPEAFYSCSDVVFAGGSSPSPTPSPTPTRTPTPTPTPTPTQTGAYPAWAPYTSYAINARVSYAGLNYQCIQGHTSLPGWEPPNVPALWKKV